MKLASTRDQSDVVSFLEAVDRSLPDGGGLYLPMEYPRVDPERLAGLAFPDLAVQVLGALVGDELPDVGTLVRRAFDFPVPVVRVDDRRWALELFHGPTLAFKDFGARFLAGVLAPRGAATILTATSGDTGSAVASAFFGLAGFRVVVLYPHGRISELQERQLCTFGGNVTALSVDGAFDDCQALVKSCFADPEVKRRHRLTSANSINVARLLAQVPYYFHAYAVSRAPVICVPSGNFGNLCAGLIAVRMGLPVTFATATNANRTVPDALAGGEYRPRPSIATVSNAMDVGAPNNWERVETLLGGLKGARRALRFGSRTDQQTLQVMRRLDAAGYLADPHGAVAASVLDEVLRPGETGVFLATADPAKFPEVVERALGRRPPLPPVLAATFTRPSHAIPIANDRAALLAVLSAR